MRGNAADRAARDIPVADYLQAFRVFHRIVMDAILRESRHQAGGEPALDAARGLLEYADLATTYASDAYLQAQQLLLADDDRIRRDLLEDLLAGREPDGGGRLAAANAAGLTQRVAVRPDRGGSGRAPRRRACASPRSVVNRGARSATASRRSS